MKKYNHTIIEDWWRHNGIWDRQDASGILYDGKMELFLESTDEWWDNLTNEQKVEIYNEFFGEV